MFCSIIFCYFVCTMNMIILLLLIIIIVRNSISCKMTFVCECQRLRWGQTGPSDRNKPKKKKRKHWRVWMGASVMQWDCSGILVSGGLLSPDSNRPTLLHTGEMKGEKKVWNDRGRRRQKRGGRENNNNNKIKIQKKNWEFSVVFWRRLMLWYKKERNICSVRNSQTDTIQLFPFRNKKKTLKRSLHF